MEIKRHGLTAGIALLTTFALAACGSDNTEAPAAGGDASASASASAIECATGSLTAQGSSAQKNAMDEWIKAYQQACPGAQINYQSTGSGAGIQAFIGNTADFGGSDSTLKEGEETTKANARCTGGQAIHLPMVVGPIALAYKIEGVKELNLKPATIAGIFSGKITKWDAPEIKADNPNATLPSTPILAVHRVDSSGTTDNFTRYMAATAPDVWTFGGDKSWKAPGGQAEKGNEGVASAVARSTGGIGYMEWSFATVNNLGVAKVYNGANELTELTSESASKGMATTTVAGTGEDLKLKIDYATKEAGAYPINLVAYEIVCTKGNSADKLPLLKSFFTYTASEAGQASLEKIKYGPLPETLRSKVEAAVQNMS